MKNQLALLVVLLIIIAPYSLLLYKKVNLRIRLLFVSLAELSVLSVLITIDFLGNGFLAESIFFYNSYVWLSIGFNFLLIFCSWLYAKMKLKK
jgi:hypothetical protein